MPQRNLTIVIASALLFLVCYQKTQRVRYALGISEAMELITDNYVEEVDRQQLYENAMEGLVGGLDQYSGYISREDFRAFNESINQEFGGIGIVVEENPQTKRLTVLSPLVGAPAYEQGMRAGDVILRIEGQDTEGMSLQAAVDIMRGPPGSPVSIVIQHRGEEAEVPLTITRQTIPVDSILGETRLEDGQWSYQLEEDPRISLVRLTNFGERTVDELLRALHDNPNGGPPQALILDLRDNAGGLLDAAVRICDMFIAEGSIVSTRRRNGRNRLYEATAAMEIPANVPVAILVNHYSASASEIVAACLQDHHRAVIIGERTWGKGTVQNIIKLESGQSALRLTTASYWRPSGKNIHRARDASDSDVWGVRPNPGYEVKLSDEDYRKVLLLRRQRDIFYGDTKPETESEPPVLPKPPAPLSQPPATPDRSLQPPAPELSPADPASDSPAAVTDTPSPVEDQDDPQLRRAIEYLQKELDQAAAA